jgi:hypothetical protein
VAGNIDNELKWRSVAIPGWGCLCDCEVGEAGGAKIAVLRHDGLVFNVNPSRKNGDESSKDAAKAAAAPVSVGRDSAVSHAAGLEASPPSRPAGPPQGPMGFAAPSMSPGVKPRIEIPQ